MLQEKIWELMAKKLSGEASVPEIKELEALLRSYPDMHYPVQTIEDLWHHNQPPGEDPYEAFTRHQERIRQMDPGYQDQQPYTEELPGHTSRRKKLTYIISGLAITALLIVGYRALWPVQPPPVKLISQHSEVSTRYGSKTKLTLPDGSQVWLNSGSKLTYDKQYGTKLREVFLTGEAYFDVVKNAEHPFIIHTQKVDIKVLGTAFNVKSYPGEKNTETSLIRGSVEVTVKDRPEEKFILKPHEKLVVSNEVLPVRSLPVKQQQKQAAAPVVLGPIIAINHLSYEPKDSTIIETSWVQNKLIFRSETFEDLAAKMERWYNVSIHFSQESLKTKKFTGIFQDETIQQAMTALRFIATFNYKINGNEITITK